MRYPARSDSALSNQSMKTDESPGSVESPVGATGGVVSEPQDPEKMHATQSGWSMKGFRLPW